LQGLRKPAPEAGKHYVEPRFLALLDNHADALEDEGGGEADAALVVLELGTHGKSRERIRGQAEQPFDLVGRTRTVLRDDDKHAAVATRCDPQEVVLPGQLRNLGGRKIEPVLGTRRVPLAAVVEREEGILKYGLVVLVAHVDEPGRQACLLGRS